MGDFVLNRGWRTIVSKLHPSRLREAWRAWQIFDNPLQVIRLYLGLDSLADSTDIKLRVGYKITITNIHNLLSIWGIWVRHDYPLSGSERIVIDAGANIGAFSLFAASKSPRARIVAIEPASKTYKALLTNIARNRLGGAN